MGPSITSTRSWCFERMILWTAFLLGLVGSAHCAGMCGPLVLALASRGGDPTRLLAGRLSYNAGRLVTYAAIGSAFGLLGQSLAVAGFQRWVSIAAGAAILSGLLTSSRFVVSGPIQRMVTAVKQRLGRLLGQPGCSAQFGFGLLNGFLPCGLVYAAAAGATATGSIVDGISYMLAFGLGTVPMMLALGLAGQRLSPALRFRMQRFVPVSLAIVATLLILRGLSLGIPYLSPELGRACH